MDEPEYSLVAVTRDIDSIEDQNHEPDFFQYLIGSTDNPIDHLSAYGKDTPLIVSSRESELSSHQEQDYSTLLQASEFEFVEKVEITLSTARSEEQMLNELRRNNVEIVVSYRNPSETPKKKEIIDIIDECSRYGDIAAVSTFANEPEDALLLLDSLNTASESGSTVTGHSLGELGQHTRVISIFYGSILCYGYLDPNQRDEQLGEIEFDRLAELIDSTVHGGDNVELMDVLKGKFS